jgi:hypothetical protein
MKVEPAPVRSAANADVDAATRPAATIALTKFIAGLHLVSEVPMHPIALTRNRLEAVDAGFTKLS